MFYLVDIPEGRLLHSLLRSSGKIAPQTGLIWLPKQNKTSRNLLPTAGHCIIFSHCLPTEPQATPACSKGVDAGRTERQPERLVSTIAPMV